MKYWVVIDNRQHGPLTIEELAAWGRLRHNTPVWHEGLPSWVNASEVDSLAVLLTPPSPMKRNTMPLGATAKTAMPRVPGARQLPKPVPKEPANYLLPAIISTILCCIPTGIVAIWMATRVTYRYEHGDFYGAKRASQATAMWLITTITLGLITIPFQMIMMSI